LDFFINRVTRGSFLFSKLSYSDRKIILYFFANLQKITGAVIF